MVVAYHAIFHIAAFAGARDYPHLGVAIRFITRILGCLPGVKAGHHPRVRGKSIPGILYVEMCKITSH